MKIKWTNKYSGETGYVADTKFNKGYFVNGSEKEAKSYKTKSAVMSVIKRLNEVGEGENNIFEMVD